MNIKLLIIGLLILSMSFIGCIEKYESLSIKELVENGIKYDYKNVSTKGYVYFDLRQNYDDAEEYYTPILYDSTRTYSVDLGNFPYGKSEIEPYTHIEVKGLFLNGFYLSEDSIYNLEPRILALKVNFL